MDFEVRKYPKVGEVRVFGNPVTLVITLVRNEILKQLLVSPIQAILSYITNKESVTPDWKRDIQKRLTK